jgi:hypothetical protein
MRGEWTASALLMLVPLLFGSTLLAQTPTTPSPAFQATDTSGDGRIDRAEFHYRMMDAFFLLDQDKDGNLTPSELPGVTAEAIRAADTDSDGKLSAIEYMNSITARNATTEPTRISASSILHSTFNMLTSPLGEPLRS